MKSIVYFLVLFCIQTNFSQEVRGVVFDEKRQPLARASIYFDGTSIGTLSDENGYFYLKVNSKTNASLVISFIGFESQYVSNFNSETPLVIILKEKIQLLNEVKVVKNRFSRKQMLQLFREQFLGLGKEGRECFIENEENIDFNYNERDFTIAASSNSPLVIINKYLGYKISYDIADFQIKFSRLSISSNDVIVSYYAGNSKFEEINNSKLIIKNRSKAFQGSSLQLFRNLIVNKWSKKEFLLFKKGFLSNASDHFLIKDTLGLKRIKVTKQPRSFRFKDFVAEFTLLYNNDKQSEIIFNTDVFYVDEFGVYSDYDKIVFSGVLSKYKLGLLLPSNYGLNNSK